jgi:hypothetical protein
LKFQTWKIVLGDGDPSLALGMTLFFGLGLGKEVAIRGQNINLRNLSTNRHFFPSVTP